MTLRIVRLGTARARIEGLRVGTVRHPPRRVPKGQHATRKWYEVWLPELTPTVELAESAQIDPDWAAFATAYYAEQPDPAAALAPLTRAQRSSRRSARGVGGRRCRLIRKLRPPAA